MKMLEGYDDVKIPDAIEEGFEKNLLRPNEFGGDMGTTDVTNQILSLLES